jgi:hypothetical protein
MAAAVKEMSGGRDGGCYINNNPMQGVSTATPVSIVPPPVLYNIIPPSIILYNA